jgi:hypothetical protein
MNIALAASRQPADFLQVHTELAGAAGPAAAGKRE